MKYDYFERDGAARLYRIPQGQQEPVEFVCGGGWHSSVSFVSKRYLRAEGLTSQVNAARARKISEGAPVDIEPSVRYFYNDVDIYRQTGVDTFHYWSDVAGDWDEPVTPGWEITNYPEITAEKAEALVLERTKVAAPAPVTITLPGDFRVLERKYNRDENNTTFTLTPNP